MTVEPETKPVAEEAETADSDESEGAPAEATETKTEEKRICRRIRADASSRRATRVCKTKEEWREFNQRR